MTATVVPDVGPLPRIKPPTVAERTTSTGLRILAVRRPSVPRVEVRLLVPSARDDRAADGAVLRVLAKTLLSGTDRRDSVTLAEDLQRMGGGLDAGADAEDVVLYGSALSVRLRPFLELMAEVVTSPTYPRGEVMLERERISQELTLAHSQPSTIAREAFLRRFYGTHPYGRGLPPAEKVQRVGPAALRRAHGGTVRPEGAVLIMVGDLRPSAALDVAEAAFAGWETGGGPPGLARPKPPVPGPTLIVDRPGAVQTNIRIGGPAVNRAHPDYPKLALANLVFGGYFTSRLVDNIRERRGYTYSPGSGVAQQRSAAHLSVQADVGTEVTAPALVEIRYELGRMVSAPPDEAELTAAKRYLTGTLSMTVQTQAGLASYLSNLVVAGLTIEYLRDLPRRVERLGVDDVLDAARTYLSPKRMVSVMVGDAAAIRAGVEATDDVEVVGR